MDGPGAALSPHGRPARPLLVALAAVPASFLALFYVWPFTRLIARAFTLDAIGDVLGRARTWEVVWFTTWQAAASTALTLVLGIVPAYVFARYEFRGRRFAQSLLLAVFVLPTVVVGAAFLAVLPDSISHSAWGILAAHVVFNLAVVVRTVGAVWQHLPPDLEAAAATLGASPRRVALDVTLPLLRPALAAAAGIVFLFTFTSFGVIRVLGGPGRSTIEVEVWRRATQLGELDHAAILSLLQLLILGMVASWSVHTQRRHTRSLALRPSAVRRRPRGRRQWIVVIAATTGAVAAVGVPLLALVERSLRTPSGYSLAAWRHLGRTEVRRGVRLGVDPMGALWSSLTAAVQATLVAVVVGGVAALAIAALGRRGRLLDAGLTLPLGTSAVTIGFGMLITFDAPPVDWRAEPWLVPVGHALVAIPFVVRPLLGVLRSIDPKLSEAAAVLGASPTRSWATVVVPRVWRPLAAGGGLAAAISLGEFGATSFLARRDTETMPIVIERLVSRSGSLLHAQGYALAVILAAATIVLVALVDLGGDHARHR